VLESVERCNCRDIAVWANNHNGSDLRINAVCLVHLASEATGELLVVNPDFGPVRAESLRYVVVVDCLLLCRAGNRDFSNKSKKSKCTYAIVRMSNTASFAAPLGVNFRKKEPASPTYSANFVSAAFGADWEMSPGKTKILNRVSDGASSWMFSGRASAARTSTCGTRRWPIVSLLASSWLETSTILDSA